MPPGRVAHANCIGSGRAAQVGARKMYEVSVSVTGSQASRGAGAYEAVLPSPPRRVLET